MMTVEEITEEILRKEGGFVNDPDDPGGATNYGVTIHTMRRLKLDLTGDGLVSVADVKRLTRDQAADIFERDYYEKPRINKLPKELQPAVYDMNVNAGSNSIRILQRVLTKLGFKTVADGVIGPKTISTTQKAFNALGFDLVDAYGTGRINYYFAIANRRPASRKYVRTRAGGKAGWIKRAEFFMSPSERLTDNEFNKRVSAWA